MQGQFYLCLPSQKIYEIDILWKVRITTPPTVNPLLLITPTLNDTTLPTVVIANYSHLILINSRTGRIIKAYYVPMVTSMSLVTINQEAWDNIIALYEGHQYWKLLICSVSCGILWEKDVGRWIFPGIIISDVNNDKIPEIIIQNRTGYILTLNITNGVIIWSRRIGTIPYFPIYFAVGDINNDSVTEIICADHTGMIYALSGKNGSLLWWYYINSLFASPIIADVNGDKKLEVVVVNREANVYAISGENGTILWKCSLPTSTVKSTSCIPADINGDGIVELIIGTYYAKLYVLNGLNGSIIFSFNTEGHIVANPVTGDMNGDNFLDIVVGDTEGNLYIISGATFSVIWNYKLDNSVSKSPIIADIDCDGKNELIVACDDGYVYAFDFKNSGKRVYWPMFRGTPENIGNQIAIDHDLDLLSDYTEIAIGSDVNNSDTDSDNLPDWWEFTWGTNVSVADANLDYDSDNLTNLDEFKYLTNPLSNDTDSDGIPDMWEIKHNLNPRDSTDSGCDFDNDLLPNWEEYMYGTDPWNPDSDGDGFLDGDEVFAGCDPLDPNSHPFTFGENITYILMILGVIVFFCGIFYIKVYKPYAIKRKQIWEAYIDKIISFENHVRTLEMNKYVNQAFLNSLEPKKREGLLLYINTGDEYLAARFSGLSVDCFDELRIKANIPRVVFYEEEDS